MDVSLGLALPLGVLAGVRLASGGAPLLAGVTAALQAVPSLVYGLLAWIVLTHTAGPLARAVPAGSVVGEAQTWLLLFTVLVVASFPTTAATVADTLGRLPRGPVHAALALGATPADVRRDVLLPALRPVLGAEVGTTFARSAAALAPVALLSTTRTPLLPVDVVTAAESGRVAEACAMASALGMLVALVAVLAAGDRPTETTPAGAEVTVLATLTPRRRRG